MELIRQARHKKTGKIYRMLNPMVINATNKNKNEVMVLYADDDDQLFVREKNEFYEKFQCS